MMKSCQYCPNEYESSRQDSKYCSNSCRVKASVARKEGREREYHSPTAEYAITNPVKSTFDKYSLLLPPPIATSNNRLGFIEKQVVSTGIGLIGKYIEKNHLEKKSSLNDNIQNSNGEKTIQGFLSDNATLVCALLGGIIGFIASDRNQTSNAIKGALIGGGIGYLTTTAINYFTTPTLPSLFPSYQVNQNLLSSTAMSTNQLADQVFDTYNFTNSEFLKEFIGEKPDKQFQMVLYGLPKTGKSTLSLYLSRQLARFGKVLYVASEEGLTETFRERIVRLGVKHDNIIVTPTKDINTIIQLGSTVNFIVIDSLSMLSKQEEITLSTIRQYLPHIATISILQSTKDGGHRGNQQLLHDTGVIVNTIGNGKATVQSRYKSTTGEYSFEDITDYERNNPKIFNIQSK